MIKATIHFNSGLYANFEVEDTESIRTMLAYEGSEWMEIKALNKSVMYHKSRIAMIEFEEGEKK